MGDDLVVLAIIPVVTALVQAAKQFLSEAVRDKFTVVLAMAIGVGCLAVYQVAQGVTIDCGKAVAQVVLHGVATGLAAAGLYSAITDIKSKKE